jgi:hypothetical protein
MKDDESTQHRRRWIGAAFLALAVLLVLAGQTLLKPWLHGLTFIAYWVFCLLCIAAAMFVALLDFRSIARKAQQEHADLLRRALNPGSVNPTLKPGAACNALGPPPCKSAAGFKPKKLQSPNPKEQ